MIWRCSFVSLNFVSFSDFTFMYQHVFGSLFVRQMAKIGNHHSGKDTPQNRILKITS